MSIKRVLVTDDLGVKLAIVEPPRAVRSILVGEAVIQFDGTTDGNKGDITVSGGGVNWAINAQQLANKFVFGEVPTGLINGSNAVFTIANQCIPESLTVEVNGLRQKLANDYTVSGGLTITFLVSPVVGDLILVNYIKV
jgi:hypothetical protein